MGNSEYIRRLIENDAFSADRVTDLIVRSIQTVADNSKTNIQKASGALNQVRTELENALEGFVSTGDPTNLDRAVGAIQSMTAELGRLSAAIDGVKASAQGAGVGVTTAPPAEIPAAPVEAPELPPATELPDLTAPETEEPELGSEKEAAFTSPDLGPEEAV